MYGASFRPFSRSGAIVRGMVTLTADPTAPPVGSAGDWKVVTVDVDGAVGRLRDAAQTLPPAEEADAASADGVLTLQRCAPPASSSCASTVAQS